jgi:hypothetical protein
MLTRTNLEYMFAGQQKGRGITLLLSMRYEPNLLKSRFLVNSSQRRTSAILLVLANEQEDKKGGSVDTKEAPLEANTAVHRYLLLILYTAVCREEPRTLMAPRDPYFLVQKLRRVQEICCLNNFSILYPRVKMSSQQFSRTVRPRLLLYEWYVGLPYSHHVHVLFHTTVSS